jgi:hypothetical protein
MPAYTSEQPRPNNGGHYTAIWRQHELGTWYEYDNDQVNIANFRKMCHGVCTVKMHLQRAATILFYIVSKPPTSVNTSNLSDIDGNEGSINSNENSHRSRFSDIAGDNNNIQSDAQNDVVICEVGCNSDRTRIGEVSISVISALIKLYHMIHFTSLFVINSSCYSRRLKEQRQRLHFHPKLIVQMKMTLQHQMMMMISFNQRV